MNIINRIYIGRIMESEGITVSVRYRPGNLLGGHPVKVTVDGGRSFSLSTEGVKQITLAPGMHDFRMRCRFKKKDCSINIESPTKITIGFCKECGDIRAKIRQVNSADELDYERIGY
jgi:hypothetical protein